MYLVGQRSQHSTAAHHPGHYGRHGGENDVDLVGEKEYEIG